MIIIGLTGTLGAGKGTIVEMLARQHSFVHFSVRSYLTEMLLNENKEINRDSMTLIANELRAAHSPSYIIEQLFEKAAISGKNCIIESIRTPGEVEALRKKERFFLIAVDATPKTRYQRIRNRNSETDQISYEVFLENELREMNNSDPNHQNLSRCIAMADYLLKNDGDLNQLEDQLQSVVANIETKLLNNNTPPEKPHQRPSWDEYFMEIAHTVSKRATCDRGRSGCVIARGRQILVTGYVGSPNGLPHCDDVGHQMKQMIHEDGKITHHCVRTVHAEQNAICQAARLGISIEGATLYCRMTPCRVCAMLIINCGLKRVVCEKKYHAGAESEEMFKAAGVQLEYVADEILRYDNQ